MRNLIPVSEHLHVRPYQVAVSRDRDLELRKWDHVGTTYAVSHRSAAFRHASGDIVREVRGIFEFSNGLFVRVWL